MVDPKIKTDEATVEHTQQAATKCTSREHRLSNIRSSFEKLSRPLGGRDWKRDDLLSH